MQATIAKLQQLFRERRELTQQLEEIEQAIAKELGEEQGGSLDDMDAQLGRGGLGRFDLGTREMSEKLRGAQPSRPTMTRFNAFAFVGVLYVVVFVVAFLPGAPIAIQIGLAVAAIAGIIAAFIGMSLARDAARNRK